MRMFPLAIAMVLTAMVVMASCSKAPSANADDGVYIIKTTYAQLLPETKKQVTCLAHNILFEAGNEPVKGQLAVAIVTMNRVRSEDYPNNVCEVVQQKSKGTCQFSWWCEAKLRVASQTNRLTSSQREGYNDIRDLAMFVYLNYDYIHDNTDGATFYHADYVNPKWRHLNRTVKIGRHIFYNTGEVNSNDEQIKSRTETGKASTLVFSPYGGSDNEFLQASYRVDIRQ